MGLTKDLGIIISEKCWGQCVVATTCWNSTHSLLTSAKFSIGYLVVGITRELDKEPSLYYPLYIYSSWSMLQQYLSSP